MDEREINQRVWATTTAYTCARSGPSDFDPFRPKIVNYPHSSWPCPYCGTRRSVETEYCPSCGAPKGSD